LYRIVLWYDTVLHQQSFVKERQTKTEEQAKLKIVMAATADGFAQLSSVSVVDNLCCSFERKEMRRERDEQGSDGG